MNTKNLRMIVAIAVALTIAIGGIVSASPEVPAPNETSKIEITESITVLHGSLTETESLMETHSTMNLSDSNLTFDERVGQIQYDENLHAIGDYTSFEKVLTFDGSNAPNLGVEKRLGFNAGTGGTSWVDATENVGMSIVTEGDMAGVSGMEGLCPWAGGACIPAGNEMIAAGSQLSRVTYVSTGTKTAVTTTDSPRLHYEIDARGLGSNETDLTAYGAGKVSAGMRVSVQEGHGCVNGTYPLAGELTYSELTTATGDWKFAKSVTYTAQIPAVGMPRQYPIFHRPA